MCVKCNATDFAQKYPLAAKVVNESFYGDDCITGADTVEQAIETHPSWFSKYVAYKVF